MFSHDSMSWTCADKKKSSLDTKARVELGLTLG